MNLPLARLSPKLQYTRSVRAVYQQQQSYLVIFINCYQAVTTSKPSQRLANHLLPTQIFFQCPYRRKTKHVSKKLRNTFLRLVTNLHANEIILGHAIGSLLRGLSLIKARLTMAQIAIVFVQSTYRELKKFAKLFLCVWLRMKA